MVEAKFIEKELRLELKVGNIILPTGSKVWVHSNEDRVITFNYPKIQFIGLTVTILVDGLLINIPQYYLKP